MGKLPGWFLDEEAMRTFISQGGNSQKNLAEKERFLGRFAATHRLQERERIGYVIVQAPIGAERMRWMFCAPEFSYMPTFLPSEGEIDIIGKEGERFGKQQLEDVSGPRFLHISLNYCFVLRRDC